MALSDPKSSRPVPITVAPVRHRGGEIEDLRPTAILFVGDPESDMTTPVDLLTKLFGLTKAEAVLTVPLLEGHGLEKSAEQAGMTFNTAKTHMKRIFAKTRTHRQAELVRLILRSPAGLRFD
jgi:DNA-binding CsgD family transcriptional regulator